MEEDVKICGNCKKSVASDQFTLHEAHCLRFLVLCPECGKSIPKLKMKEHHKNEHQLTGKPQELMGSLNKLQIQEPPSSYQGECCAHCGQFIEHQLMALHRDVCQVEQALLGDGKRISASERKTDCDYYNQTFPENEGVHHTLLDTCCPVSESGKHHPLGKTKIPPVFLPRQASGNQPSTATKDVRPKTKFKNRFPQLFENLTQQAPRRKNRTVDPSSKAEHKPRTEFATEEEAAYNILRSCSGCGILLPLPTLCQHQMSAVSSLESRTNENGQLDSEKRHWFAQGIQMTRREKDNDCSC